MAVKRPSCVLILLICWMAHPASAQEELISRARIFDSPENFQTADVVFGPATPARIYTTSEVARWGFDFVTSPSRAKDRHLFFAYKLSRLSLEQIKQIVRERKNADSRQRFAFVNEIKSGPLPQLGSDRAFYAIPVLSISNRNPKAVAEFCKFLPYLAPRLVALGALKSVGIDVSKLSDFNFDPANAKAFIAINEQIPSVEPDKYFVIGETLWLIPDSHPAATWGIEFSVE
jgi:hypothetical protein